ncbi:hypothetical protein [Haloarcula onubensis]|uniref:Uncharacterized protein n=1 Tax=Haloarcula onubensis TaxID=2950539 RepID=A0ABU2FNQ2_9EURY|nr:hypothetical protein [Halomicroarcula sp. S3CR25-11]MDS0282384.1 hypothetical protein [Halomicroarcula sp. S3CR25-11]
MPSTVDNPTVTDLLLVIVFQLGLCVLLLGAITNATQGFDTALGSLGQVVGSLTAVGALVALLVQRRLRTV